MTNKHLFLLLLPLFSIGQQTLSLEECMLYPIKLSYSQTNWLATTKSVWKLKRLIKQNSKIDLNAQATYQSDVTSLPISLPNVTVNPPNKDQYRATVDVNQLIYNGGPMPLLKSKKRKPKRCNNKPRSTYTNSDPESISCISRPFCYKSDMLF
jgi:hypothetical protein